MKVDLKKDLFHIAYDPKRVTPQRILEAIASKGFRSEVVIEGFAAPPAEPKVGRDFGRLPAEFERAVKQAKKANKPLLIAFHGPGCPPCKRMDTETYLDSSVKAELRCWMLLRVDVSEHREVAKLFEVTGIPVAVAATTDGEELGRIENFVEPAVFRERLAELRPRPGE
jgi:thiol:disulfide interchange protein